MKILGEQSRMLMVICDGGRGKGKGDMRLRIFLIQNPHLKNRISKNNVVEPKRLEERSNKARNAPDPFLDVRVLSE